MKNQNKTNTKEIETNLQEKNNFTLHVMPTSISDDDIQSLFGGLLKVVKKKFELDARAEMINMNLSQEKLIKALNEKQAECNRLKNEILFLKNKT